MIWVSQNYTFLMNQNHVLGTWVTYFIFLCRSSLTTDETLEEGGRKITSSHQWGAGDNHARPDPLSSNSQKAVCFTPPITPSNLLSPTVFEDKRHGSGVTPCWCEEGGNLLVYLANFTPCEIVWFRAQSELLFTCLYVGLVTPFLLFTSQSDSGKVILQSQSCGLLNYSIAPKWLLLVILLPER